jgi:predicted MFS family arabinose efflux permease
VVPDEDRPSANSLTMLSGSLTGIAGPALGALIVAAGGTALAFGLDALSFFIAALALLPLLRHRPAAPRPAAAGGAQASVWEDLRGGLQAVLASPWLWITILIAALSNMALSSAFSTSLPFLVKDAWGMDVKALGAILSAYSAGSVLAALLLGSRKRLRRRGPLAYLTWALCGLMLASFGLQSNLWAALAAGAVMGATLTVGGLIWTNTLQEIVPSHLLGRVSSIDYLGSFALLPVGFALAGWATDLIGPQAVFVIAGGFTALLALLGLLHPAIRGMD